MSSEHEDHCTDLWQQCCLNNVILVTVGLLAGVSEMQKTRGSYTGEFLDFRQ